MPIDAFPRITDQVARQAYLAVCYCTVNLGFIATTSTTFVDVSATNLFVTFTAPPSGQVFVHLDTLCSAASSATSSDLLWSLRAGTTDVGVSAGVLSAGSTVSTQWERHGVSLLVPGLIPGQSYTWKWTHRVSVAYSMSTYAGAATYPAIMLVTDAGVNTSGVMSGGIWSGPQVINTGDPAGKALVIKGAPSQTANLQEWTDSTGVVKAKVDATGDYDGGFQYPTSHRNIVINGAFDIWQRGTSFTSVSPFYCADRWQMTRAGAVAGGTFSRQLAGVGVPSYSCARLSRDSGNASTAALWLATSFETQRIAELRNEYVTISFWARAGANALFTGLTATLQYGTGTDGSVATGSFTAQAAAFSASQTLTTSWQLFTITGLVPANATQLGVWLSYTPTGTAGAADYVEITAVQLEKGQFATPFERQQIQMTLAQCQRYFARFGGSTGTGYSYLGTGLTTGASLARVGISLPVPMRGSPTVAFSTTTAVAANTGGAGATFGPFLYQVTAIYWSPNSPMAVFLDCPTSVSVQVGYPAFAYVMNAVGNFADFNAEL